MANNIQKTTSESPLPFFSIRPERQGFMGRWQLSEKISTAAGCARSKGWEASCAVPAYNYECAPHVQTCTKTHTHTLNQRNQVRVWVWANHTSKKHNTYAR
ncbi:hypothetical protein MKJ04_00015 [Pontibacter sp. E15-1]|uniref:hypothetical protein n=1 Tax=Pontibacter sp. E15-1 TaxID=2919918 RepID=UPI001F4F69AF|nr:hypothetical protein [Pontibacter sp. E15-1]MCJ8163205.1 hypothetical protein [Pontibacter sp. E15-1]